MRDQSKCKNKNKKTSAQSARSAQSAWSARSAVCSLHGLRCGVTDLHVWHTVHLSTVKGFTPTTVSIANICLRIPQHLAAFSSWKKTNKQTHTICNNRLHIVDPSYRERAQVAFWLSAIARKDAWTVISRSFPRSVITVTWPEVQRRFAHGWKFQKLFNDRGEMISNLG